MRGADGSVVDGSLRVRFGEVEARGIALTRAGRALYDRLLGQIDEQVSQRPAGSRDDIARAVWEQHMPGSEQELAADGLAYFTYRLDPDRLRDGGRPLDADRSPAEVGLGDLLAQGWVRADPIVYEDFLPRSAAGIFQSNLSGEGTRDNEREGEAYDAAWLSGAIDREVLDPFVLYENQQNDSLAQVARALGDIRIQPLTPTAEDRHDHDRPADH